jgi:hypothetical protein
MSSINQWEIFCETENKFVQFLSISGNPPPIVCPNNNEHTITNNRTFLEKVIQQEELKIKEETIPTQGFYKVEGKIMNCPANIVSTQETILKRPASTLAFYASTVPANYKDTLDVYVNLGIIGVLSQNLEQNSSSISIITPIFENIPVGFEIYIGETCFGEILAKNSENNTLTVEIPASQQYTTGTPVSLKNRMMKNFIIGLCPRYEFGLSTIGGTYMSSSYTVTTHYTNISNEDKTLIYYVEYLY